MWKKHGETEKQYAARNIITNKIPTGGDNKDISIVGIYYMDGNGNFDIYTDQKKNYTTFNSYSDKILYWNWVDTKTVDGVEDSGIDTFVLDENNFYFSTESAEGFNVIIRGGTKMKNSYDVIKQIEVVLNRLPKTYKKSPTASKALYNDSKVLMRLNNLTNVTSSDQVISNNVDSNNSLINKSALQKSLIRANKIAARSSHDVKVVKAASANQIEPKIQAAYGFADFGKIVDLNVDGYLSPDDGSFITTHKIGYEESDRYRTGEASCDSFLFLSPLNHSEIQVNGDTNRSHTLIKPNESLKVPIIYQYRMEDYKGRIFGNDNYTDGTDIVKNTKFANIIGIDIWLNTLSDTPKQYDIVVYSTYNADNSRTTGAIAKKL
jgi:hypothetical protein